MKRDPFTLLCALLQVSLRMRAADAVLAGALDGIDWPRLVRLSGVHLLTPALAPALADPALRERVPEDLHLYLRAMLESAAERNLVLRAQLEDVASCLNRSDVIPVVLKGGARLIDGLWPEPAFRFMHDLDLLVPEASMEACIAALASAGWRTFEADVPDERHVMLAHPGAIARIELHRTPLPQPWADLLPAARMLTRAKPAPMGRAMVALPSTEDQLVHLVAHGMLQHQFLRNGRFLLRDLIELRRLSALAGAGAARAARSRFAAVHEELAWDVAVELGARCLGTARDGSSVAARILALRMLLQQRRPGAMLVLGPISWLASGLLAGGGREQALWPPRRFAARLRVFYRKTMW
ncbi:MAG: nucleotidyltransferase family protein [Geminicoccaceae bacterium]